MDQDFDYSQELVTLKIILSISGSKSFYILVITGIGNVTGFLKKIQDLDSLNISVRSK